MQKYWRRCWFFCSADATTGIQNTNCQIAQAGARRKPFSGIRRKWMRSRRFPKKALEKPQAFRKNVRHRRQHRKKRCRFISAVRSLPPVSTRCRAEAAPRRDPACLHVTTFCLNAGCCIDYSKKYVYLQYKKTPTAQHYTVQRASYLSAERNGMWYKYRKISQKRHVFKIRIRRECSSPHERPEIKRRAWRCYAFRPAS